MPFGEKTDIDMVKKAAIPAGIPCAVIICAFLVIGCNRAPEVRRFNLWATADAHVNTDLKYGYESIAAAVRQSEFGGEAGGPPFEWDVMLHLGDLKGSRADGQGFPDDADGVEVVRQFLTMKKHRREQVYNLPGNHDASGPGEPTQWWFRKWVDPIGESVGYSRVHADRRPYPVSGTWERYYFRVGNILFLMLGDRNDGGPPAGRSENGRGYPAGAVTRETFDWWVDMVERNGDCIIVTCHHHMLRNTTVASGDWEGTEGMYHGALSDGDPKGASYLSFVGGEPGAGLFERYLAGHPGAIDLWLGGHTHTNPDDRYGGRSHIEGKWGATFVNVAALSRHHGWHHTVPMSRLLTFTPGSDSVRIRCYLHTSDYAAQGWYDRVEETVTVGKPFRW